MDDSLPEGWIIPKVRFRVESNDGTTNSLWTNYASEFSVHPMCFDMLENVAPETFDGQYGT